MLGSLYWFWLRDSPLVAVERVEVTGLTTGDAKAVRSALAAAARDMTTLHVRVDELEATAASFPVIKELAVKRDFPNALRIEVVEHRPAALVMVGEAALPAAADGTVLEGLRPPEGLVLLESEKPTEGERVTDPQTLRALAVIGAAPGELPERIAGLSEDGERGIVVELEDGPEVVFGEADRLEAKWAAATRVLADPRAKGAAYVDVRLPERPVAGGLPVETVEPVAPAGEPITPPPADPAAPADPGAAAVDPGVATDPAAAPTDPGAAPSEPAPGAAGGATANP